MAGNLDKTISAFDRLALAVASVTDAAEVMVNHYRDGYGDDNPQMWADLEEIAQAVDTLRAVRKGK